jgi:hypothetical protein
MIILMLRDGMHNESHINIEDSPFLICRADCLLQGYAYVAIGLAASAFLTFPVAVALLKPKPAPQPLKGEPAKPTADEDAALQEVVIAKTPPHSGAASGDADSATVAEPRSNKLPAWSERESRRAAITSSVSAPAGPVLRVRGAHVSPFNSWQRAGEAVSWQADGPREAHAFERNNSLNARRAMLAVSIAEDSKEQDVAGAQSCPVKEVELVEAQPGSKQQKGAQRVGDRLVDLLKIRCAHFYFSLFHLKGVMHAASSRCI